MSLHKKESETARLIHISPDAPRCLSAHTSPTQQPDDPFGRIRWIFVLPDPDDSPARCAESPVRVSVAMHVAGDLVGPVPAVYIVAPPTMLRAAVPEAPIDEHSDTKSGEHEVGTAIEISERPNVHSVPGSATV